MAKENSSKRPVPIRTNLSFDYSTKREYLEDELNEINPADYLFHLLPRLAEASTPSFGTHLTRLVWRKMQEKTPSQKEASLDDCVIFLLRAFELNGVPFHLPGKAEKKAKDPAAEAHANRRAVTNWLTKDTINRSNGAVILLSFALRLSVEEANDELYHKGQLECGFRSKEAYEAIAYYCLKNHLYSFRKYSELLADYRALLEAGGLPDGNDTGSSKELLKELDACTSDEQLMTYLTHYRIGFGRTDHQSKDAYEAFCGLCSEIELLSKEYEFNMRSEYLIDKYDKSDKPSDKIKVLIKNDEKKLKQKINRRQFSTSQIEKMLYGYVNPRNKSGNYEFKDSYVKDVLGLSPMTRKVLGDILQKRSSRNLRDPLLVLCFLRSSLEALLYLNPKVSAAHFEDAADELLHECGFEFRLSNTLDFFLLMLSGSADPLEYHTEAWKLTASDVLHHKFKTEK